MTPLPRLLTSLALAAALSVATGACGNPDPESDSAIGTGDVSIPVRGGVRPDGTRIKPRKGGIEGPGTTDPGTTDPGTTDPGTTDPGTTDPGTTDPGTTDPGTTDPGTTDPGTTDPGTTDPGTVAGVDPFGVTELYPSKTGGEEWYLADDATGDSRFDPQQTITRNSDGSWKMRSSQVRMLVFTSTGYDTSKIETQNRDQLAAKGYMQAPNDWKNVEMTGFVKLNSASDMTDNFTWYARGGRHTDSLACEGSAYKGDLYYNGRVRWAKESWHVSYDYTAYQDATTSLQGRWVGWKTVIRNLEQNGKTVVKMESYLNDNADKTTWRKVYEFVDDGAWAGDHATCGASNTKIAQTWGGPTATFRWDSATDVDFKWLSVREIQP